MELRNRSRAPPPSARRDGSKESPASTTSISAQHPPPSVNLRSLFVFLLAFRLLNALLTRTFFQPDEHYQTTEIAHQLVFGYGFKSWEWSTHSHSSLPPNSSWFRAAGHNISNGPVRSILHPLLFVPGYVLLKVTGLDQTYFLVLFPRLQQALIAAIGDWYTFRLAHRIGGEKVAWFATLVGLSNLYSLYTATRTFSNCTEAAVTAAALFYWPFQPFFGGGFDVGLFATRKEQVKMQELEGGEKGGWQSKEDKDFEKKQLARAIYDRTLKRSLCLAAGACLLRSTNGVLWTYLVSELFVRQLRCLKAKRSSPNIKNKAGQEEKSLLPTLEIIDEASSLIRTLTLVASTALTLALVVDTTYDSLSNGSSHNRPLLPALSLVAFLHKNVVSNLSIFYGANPWHWYWTQGLPVLCTVWLPATIFGLINAIQSGEWEGDEGKGAEEKKSLARLVLVTVGVYSLLGHKEFRFLQPLLPALSVLAGSGLAASYGGIGAAGKVDNGRTGGVGKSLWVALNSLPLWLRAVLLTLQPMAAIYLTSIHGVAQEQVPYELGRMYRQQQLEPVGEEIEFGAGFGRIHNLGFLMPCHSTPWATHLHNKELVEQSWFIQCPPPPARGEMTDKEKHVEYWDQSDFFYHDPIKYLVERMPFNVDTSYPASPGLGEKGENVWDQGWRHSWPSHLVVFDALLKEGTRKAGHTRTLKNLLSLKGYREVGRYWNTVKHEDTRREGDVVVLAYKGPKTHK